MPPAPGSLLLQGLPDDRLGSAAVSLVVGELHWIPDVAPMVMDRISRDAVAYPEHFDRRPGAAVAPPAPLPGPPSAGRVVGRLVVLGVILLVIVGLVFVAATASAAEPATWAGTTVGLPIDAIDGTLGECPIQPVVTEAT